MPILDIPDLNADWAHLSVLSAMLQPAASPETHQKMVAGMRAAAALDWRRKNSLASDRAKAVVWDATAADAFLLSGDAVTAYAKQGHYNKGRMAARILGLILTRTDSRKGALEWAYGEIYNRPGHLKGKSRLTLREVWLDYSSVAHLWLTEAFCPLADGLLRGEDLVGFLAASEAIRLAGEQYESQTAGGQLLVAGAAWRPSPNLDLPIWAFENGKVVSQSEPV
jgi:hypothetical protein